MQCSSATAKRAVAPRWLLAIAALGLSWLPLLAQSIRIEDPEIERAQSEASSWQALTASGDVTSWVEPRGWDDRGGALGLRLSPSPAEGNGLWSSEAIAVASEATYVASAQQCVRGLDGVAFLVLMWFDRHHHLLRPSPRSWLLSGDVGWTATGLADVAPPQAAWVRLVCRVRGRCGDSLFDHVELRHAGAGEPIELPVPAASFDCRPSPWTGDPGGLDAVIELQPEGGHAGRLKSSTWRSSPLDLLRLDGCYSWYVLECRSRSAHSQGWNVPALSWYTGQQWLTEREGLPDFEPGTVSWQTRVLRTLPPPAADALRITLRADGNPGDYWYDDVSLRIRLVPGRKLDDVDCPAGAFADEYPGDDWAGWARLDAMADYNRRGEGDLAIEQGRLLLSPDLDAAQAEQLTWHVEQAGSLRGGWSAAAAPFMQDVADRTADRAVQRIALARLGSIYLVQHNYPDCWRVTAPLLANDATMGSERRRWLLPALEEHAALCHLFMRQYEELFPALATALADDDATLISLITAAECGFANLDYAEFGLDASDRLLTKAVPIRRFDHRTWLSRGRLLSAMGRWREAEQSFLESQRLAPSSYWARDGQWNAALCQLQAGDVASARQQMSAAIAGDEVGPEERRWRGFAVQSLPPSLPPEPASGDRPPVTITGPLYLDLFCSMARQTLVVGQGGAHSDSCAKLEQWAGQWNQMLMHNTKVVREMTVCSDVPGLQVDRDSNVIYWGWPPDSDLLRPVLDDLPIQFTDTSIRAGTSYDGKLYGTVFVAPSPWNPRRSLVVFAGRDVNLIADAPGIADLWGLDYGVFDSKFKMVVGGYLAKRGARWSVPTGPARRGSEEQRP